MHASQRSVAAHKAHASSPPHKALGLAVRLVVFQVSYTWFVFCGGTSADCVRNGGGGSMVSVLHVVALLWLRRAEGAPLRLPAESGRGEGGGGGAGWVGRPPWRPHQHLTPSPPLPPAPSPPPRGSAGPGF